MATKKITPLVLRHTNGLLGQLSAFETRDTWDAWNTCGHMMGDEVTRS